MVYIHYNTRVLDRNDEEVNMADHAEFTNHLATLPPMEVIDTAGELLGTWDASRDSLDVL